MKLTLLILFLSMVSHETLQLGNRILINKISLFDKDILTQSGNQTLQKIELTEPALIIVQLDSIEIERLKDEQGEDVFFTAADDMMWYDAMLLRRMDSLSIPVIYIKEDTVDINTPNSNFIIIKDSTFSLYTYFLFDGKDVLRKDLFKLLENE